MSAYLLTNPVPVSPPAVSRNVKGIVGGCLCGSHDLIVVSPRTWTGEFV